MLFTRCPDCGTTFRVTDDALNKAHGQVRCGRCARVFNAIDEQREPPPELAGTEPGAAAATAAPHDVTAAAANERTAAGAQPPSPADRVSAHGEAAAPGADARAIAHARRESPAPTPRDAAAARPAPAAASEPQRAEHEPPRTAGAPSAATPEKTARPPAAAPPADKDDDKAVALDGGDFGAVTVADVVAEVALGTAAYPDPDEPLAGVDSAIDSELVTASQVERMLETGELSVWLLEQEQANRPSRWWGVGMIAAVVALALQGIHHYRGDLINANVIGPVVKSAYAMFGVTVIPHWDIRQYEILDWVATAEPNTRGQGTLKITAHIKNRGPQRQPYPSVHLELKDRWEDAVGSRIFAPSEYLATAPHDLMAPGETTRAEIEVVDPGPDAYGFELDVCIEVETHGLSCGSDKVFL
jgi:predicted Zn finger-like uncharacterized protein